MFTLSLLYVALTIIRPQDYMPALAGVPLLPVVLILAVLAWMFSRTRTFDAPQFPLLGLFLLVAMASLVVNHWVGGALEVLRTFGPIVLIFYVLAAGCDSRRHVTVAMAVFVLSATVLALHSVEQARTGVGWTGALIGEDGRVRYVGIFHDPNDLGLLFAATVPMAFFLTRWGGFLGRLFWLAAAVLLLYGIYLTNSRGALLAVLVMFGGYIWHRRGVVTAGVLGVLGLTALKMLSMRMQDLDPDESSAFGRVDAWYEGIHMFFSHPVLGVGVGNFTDYNQLTAHNSFVLVLAETGFVGFTLWLAFVGYGFWMMFAVLRHQPELSGLAADDWQAERRMALTLLLSLCGMFACAFFLSRSYTIILYLVIAMVVGYYVGARRRWPGLKRFRWGENLPYWLLISVVGIILLYVITTILLMAA
jgi:O-antigen ligase